MDNLTDLIVQYSYDTENADKNYALARAYHALGHTAAALSFYLRAAERTQNKLLAYECMINVGVCFEVQGNRTNSVRGAYKHAICILPERPEAYYYLSRTNERTSWYIESYMYAEMGLNFAKFEDLEPLRGELEYPGKYGLIFEKAVSSWWWGKLDECKSLFLDLKHNYVLDKIHLEAVNTNISKLNIDESKQPMFKYDTDKQEVEQDKKKSSDKKTIVDCFSYYDATCKEMLELRYNILKDHVDKFVVTEANRTQTGELVERKLKQTLIDLNLPLNKFEIVEVDIPESDKLDIQNIDKVNSYQNQTVESYQCRVRERMQKDGLLKVLDKFDDNTFFIVSDCDEVIRPEAIQFVISVVEKNRDKIIKVPLAHLEGKANLRVFRTDINTYKQWDGAMFVCTKEHLKNATVLQIRSNVENVYPISYITQDGKRVEDLGWHFSWMGDTSRRMAKLNGFVHRKEQFDFLETKSYDSEETLNRMQIDPAVGQLSISCEKNSILVPYPLDALPKELFEISHIYEYFINGKTMSDEQLINQSETNPKEDLIAKRSEIKTIASLDWGRNDAAFIAQLTSEIFEENTYEKYFEVSEGDIVFDVGANCGAFTWSVLHKKPKRVFCIEPSNSMAAAIENNTEGHPVTIINKAISNITADRQKIESKGVYIYFHENETYDKIKFSDILSQYNIDHIDFLKFDCEGGEYDIFTKENYEFISKNVDYMVGEWHVNDHENAIERFIEFRDLYLKGHKNFRIFERSGKEVTFEIFNNDYLYRFRDWWKPTQLGQWMIYIDNTKPKKEFEFNSDSKNTIWIVDDFYSNPYDVREFALKQEFSEGGFGRGYIGRRTTLNFLFPGLKERFEEIMGKKIVHWEEYSENGKFQVAWAGEPLVYHCDEQRWGGLIYLSPDAPVECGTTTYIHKSTKIRHKSHPEILKAFRQESTLDRTPYQQVDVMGNIFNRLVIFDAGCIHSASEYFGFNKENSRLWQMFFFD